jgi:hypothetical protein
VKALLVVWEVWDQEETQRAISNFPILKPFLTSYRGEVFTSWFSGGEWDRGEYPLSFKDGVLTLEGVIKSMDTHEEFGKLLDQISEEIYFYRKWYEEDETFRIWRDGAFVWNPDFKGEKQIW